MRVWVYPKEWDLFSRPRNGIKIRVKVRSRSRGRRRVRVSPKEWDLFSRPNDTPRKHEMRGVLGMNEYSDLSSLIQAERKDELIQ